MLAAVAVAHAVVAGQVGGGLGRRDDVVGGDGQVTVGQADFHQGGAQGLQFLQRLFDAGRGGGIQARAEVFPRQSYAQALQAVLQPGAVVLGGYLRGGGVLRVMAGHAIEQQGAVLGGVGHGAGLVQAGGEGHHAQAGNPSVGGLEAGDTAESRGLADGAAGVCAGGGRRQPGCHRRGRAPGGASRYGGGIPGVLYRAVEAVFIGGAHGELVHIGLAQRDHAVALEPRDQGGVIGR